MKKFALITLSLLIASASMAQSAKSLIADYVKKVNEAKSLSVSYTVQRLGGLPKHYTLLFSKPDRIRLETPTGVIAADGSYITAYEKSDKSYFRVAETQRGLLEILRPGEFYLWRAFFDPKAFGRMPEATFAGHKTHKGMDLTVVKGTVDMSNDHFVTFYFDSSGLPRQAEIVLQVEGIDTLIDTDSFELGLQPFSIDKFVFTPPVGSHPRKSF